MQAKGVLLVASVVSIFALLTVGAFVTAGNYGGECGSLLGQDYPLCQGHLLPPLQLGPVAEYTHRLLASLSSVLLFVTTLLYWKSKDSSLATRRLLYVASFLIVAEIVLGAAVVVGSEPAWLVTIHQANALLVFGFAVAALAVDLRTQ